MGEFDEIDAMKAIGEALERLDEAARGRSLRWAVSKYGIAKMPEASLVTNRNDPEDVHEQAGTTAFGTFAELFDAAQPNTERDKALVAAYWVQVCLNAGNFASQSLNNELKDLGHGVGNITEALSRLKSDRPALILQLKKSGISKQARKVYKLTTEGVKRVQTMIETNSATEIS